MNKLLVYILTLSFSYSILLQLVIFEKMVTIMIITYNLIFLLIPLLIIFFYIHTKDIKILHLASYITLIRLIITSTVFSSILLTYINDSIHIDNKIIIFMFFISLILDGIDGYFARKLKQETSYGEILDQETDNFLMLALAGSLYLNVGVSIIIFIIPLCRYIFLIFGLFFNWLQKDLPKSFRRKFVCTGVIVIMILSHFEFLSFYLVSLMSIISILILVMSFAYDIFVLYKRRNYA